MAHLSGAKLRALPGFAVLPIIARRCGKPMNQSTRTKPNRADGWALALLALLFLILLAASWQRWTRPLIDHGRELHLPTRLLAGEQLYTDILYYYGPFAPHFNALLYRVFGLRLAVPHASGAVCALLILLLCYWLARQWMNVRESTLATALVMLVCAFNPHLGNYIQPYAYAALYGLVFALCALACAVRFVQSGAARWLWWAGVSVGMVVTCKPELGALAAAPVGVAWLLVSWRERRAQWWAAWCCLVPAVTIVGVTYGWLLRRVSWQVLITDNYQLFNTPQLRFFSQRLSGLAYWPRPLWEMTAALGMLLVIAGVCAWLGSIVTGQFMPARRVWLTLAAGLLLWLLPIELFNVRADAGPLRSAAPVLLAIIVGLCWRAWHNARLVQDEAVLLLVAVFSLVAIGRVVCNIPMKNSYTAFTLPTVLLVYVYLLLRVAPAWLLAEPLSRERARQITLALFALLTLLFAVNTAKQYRNRYNFAIHTPRGTLYAQPEVGRPVAAALAFIEQHSQPNDDVLVLPQGTGLNFLAARRYPLREESVVPGFVEGAHEAVAIERLAARRSPVIVLFNLLTPEYRDRAFGVDYNRALIEWIEAHYRRVATFGARPNARLGDEGIFCLAYERKD